MSAIIKPRLAHVGEAAAVHAALWAARDDIPITATDFNSERYLEWVRNECRQKFFWVIEMDSTIAGVMLLHGDDIFYLVTTKPYQRRGVATALLAYAKKRHRFLTAKTKPDNHRTIKLLEREGFQFDSEDDWRHFAWRCPNA
jgi:GNAT superfamily N-acetyltransferase